MVTDSVPAYYHVFKLPEVLVFLSKNRHIGKAVGTKNVSGWTQRGKNEAYLCVSQESSNCGYPMQDVQTGLTKKRKRKKKRKEEKKRINSSVARREEKIS